MFEFLSYHSCVMIFVNPKFAYFCLFLDIFLLLQGYSWFFRMSLNCPFFFPCVFGLREAKSKNCSTFEPPRYLFLREVVIFKNVQISYVWSQLAKSRKDISGNPNSICTKMYDFGTNPPPPKNSQNYLFSRIHQTAGKADWIKKNCELGSFEVN